jgi:hypothetical protein
MTQRVVQVPMPVKETLAGEADGPFEPLPPWFSTPDSYNPPPQHSVRSIEDATQIGKQLMSKGIGPRAIVVTKHLELDKMIDPHYWGIVLSMPIMEPLPVEVIWVYPDGSGHIRRFHSGDDLIPIYPTRDKISLMDDLRSRRPVL